MTSLTSQNHPITVIRQQEQPNIPPPPQASSHSPSPNETETDLDLNLELTNRNRNNSNPNPNTSISHALTPVTTKQQTIVLLTSFLAVFITIGLNQSYGVFQAYYTSDGQTIISLHHVDSNVESNVGSGGNGGGGSGSNALLAFIGTLAAGLTWGGSIFVNPLMERVRDKRWITGVGVGLMSLGLGMAASSREIWHLLLTQGLLVGIGSSLLYFPILSTTPEYFSKNRGLAMGFVLSGSGVGGLVLSPLIRTILTHIGPRYTLLTLSLTNLFLSMPIALAVAPSRFIGRRSTHLSLSLLKRPAFMLSVGAAFLQAAGNLLPLTFLVEFSVAIGYSSSFGAILLAILNGVNAVSRIMTGFAGDKFGRQNTLILTVIFSAISVLCFWLGSIKGSGNKALWLLFVVGYGVAGGGYNALFPTTVIEVFGLQAYASVNGFIYFVRGMGAMVGSPVGGAILGGGNGSGLGSYRSVVWFDAALLLGATVCVIGVRWLDSVEKKLWRWKA